jgi:hypothetical protein
MDIVKPNDDASWRMKRISDGQLELVQDDDFEKAKFATRSEAARYAASIRWKGNVKGDDNGGRDPVLEQEIGRVRAMVDQLSLIPKGSKADDEIFAADWGKAVDTLFVHVTETDSWVPTAPVMAVETEIRALGKMVYENLTKSDEFNTPEQIQAIAKKAKFERDEFLASAELELQKVLGRPVLAQTVDELAVLKEEHRVASKAMMQATKDYADNQGTRDNPPTDAMREAQMRAFGERRVQQKLKARLKMKIGIKQAKIDEVTRNTMVLAPTGESVYLNTATKWAETRYQDAISAGNPSSAKFFEAVTSMVSLYRGTGGQLKVVPTSDKNAPSERAVFLKKFVDDVAKHMPKEWVDEVNNESGGSIFVTRTDGGGSWSLVNQEIRTSGTTQVNLHEFIHSAAWASSTRQAIEHAHLSKRTYGFKDDGIDEPFDQKIVNGRQSQVGGIRYPKGESVDDGIYIKDKWVDPYSGRIYDAGGTEVITVGYDSLSRQGWRAGALDGKLDMEQVYFTLGLLMAG